MTKELLNCPFCNGKARISESGWTIYCDSCVYGLPVKLWNRREQKAVEVDWEVLKDILCSFIGKEHLELKEKPTIEQLQRILDNSDAPKIKMMPDGSIEAVYSINQIIEYLKSNENKWLKPGVK